MLPVARTLLLALIPALLGLTAARAADKPNLVIMLVDDMGVMDSSVPFLTDAEGKPKRYPLNDYFRTPNMERLAERGVRFSQFNAMSVCSPTRVSILTGQNAARHHTTNWINPDDNNKGPLGPPQWNWQGLKAGDVTLPALLRAAGYRTIHAGKGHFGPRGREGGDPLNLGFDENIGGGPFGQPGSYLAAKKYGNGGPKATHAVPGLAKYADEGLFLTEALTREANARVAAAVKDGKPFYLNFAQYAVHAPFDADERFAANYRDSGKAAPAQAFATLIEGMDKSLGDVLDQLDRLGVAEDTLVIFLGDNGSDAPLGPEHAVACAAPLRGKKGTHYEGGMRVPFIAAWARANPANPHQRRLPIAAGAIQTQLANVTDLFPTLLGVAGVTAPAGHAVDGRPLDTLLTGQRDPSRPETFLMHFPHAHRSDYFTTWRDGDWKVVFHAVPGKPSEGKVNQLFNLKDDPFEQNDLAEKNPAELRRMLTGLAAELERLGAQYPEKDGVKLKPVIPGN